MPYQHLPSWALVGPLTTLAFAFRILGASTCRGREDRGCRRGINPPRHVSRNQKRWSHGRHVPQRPDVRESWKQDQQRSEADGAQPQGLSPDCLMPGRTLTATKAGINQQNLEAMDDACRSSRAHRILNLTVDQTLGETWSLASKPGRTQELNPRWGGFK